jgi:hypothetical protein
MKSGNLYQFHLAIAPPMEHIQLSYRIAEDEQVTVAKLSVLYSFLNRHRPNGDCLGTG